MSLSTMIIIVLAIISFSLFMVAYRPYFKFRKVVSAIDKSLIETWKASELQACMVITLLFSMLIALPMQIFNGEIAGTTYFIDVGCLCFVVPFALLYLFQRFDDSYHTTSTMNSTALSNLIHNNYKLFLKSKKIENSTILEKMTTRKIYYDSEDFHSVMKVNSALKTWVQLNVDLQLIEKTGNYEFKLIEKARLKRKEYEELIDKSIQELLDTTEQVIRFSPEDDLMEAKERVNHLLQEELPNLTEKLVMIQDLDKIIVAKEVTEEVKDEAKRLKDEVLRIEKERKAELKSASEKEHAVAVICAVKGMYQLE